jgi:8-oxo-dGTP diphosphatase
MSNIFTLCFIEHNQTLLLRKYFENKYIKMWNAPGGKVNSSESPLDACKREVHAGTGINLECVKFRGALTLSNYNRKRSDVLMLFQSDQFSIEYIDPINSELAWVSVHKIYEQNNTPESFNLLLPYILETDKTLVGKIIYNKKNLVTFEISF